MQTFRVVEATITTTTSNANSNIPSSDNKEISKRGNYYYCDENGKKWYFGYKNTI